MVEGDLLVARGKVGIHIIPDRIREARLDAGLTLSQVAGSLVSRAFIHRVEKGQSRPSLDVLRMIAAKTGRPLKYFLDAEVHSVESPNLLTNLETASDQVRQLLSQSDLTKRQRAGLVSLLENLNSGIELVHAMPNNASLA